MPTKVNDWSITRMQRGGLRAECWFQNCDWHRDFEDGDADHIKMVQKILLVHLRSAHQIWDVTRHSVKVAE